MPAPYRKLAGVLRYILFFIILIVAFWTIFTYLDIRKRDLKPTFPFFQKGMTYADWTKEGYLSFTSDDSLQELTRTKTEWVALIVTWYQDKYNSTNINPSHRTPSDESLVHVIRKIHGLGMKVMLKPHLDIIDKSEGKWRGDIEFDTPEDWQLWFDNYQRFIENYIDIANAENVEMFCLGTELVSSTMNHPENWRQLIQHIRDIYKGYLTYAANWYEEYYSIKFWDVLDYAGVNPYFPLTAAKSPSSEELKKAWQPWVTGLERWQAQINKPVIFTEIGYKSCEAAADNPWEHAPSGPLDLELQVNCYQALFETFFSKKWFWGVYWWHWQMAINPQISLTRGFSPRGKPAEQVILRWYKKPAPRGKEIVIFQKYKR